ncbi:hypothetical protein FNO08_14415 [Salmonella enterica subsp. diarizonae]|nr:hypothetical protein [Salmonella enterica subsp. diarizonae]ECF5967069.1 hypothetical protein [Salmonella enterica subsp. diarizonae]
MLNGTISYGQAFSAALALVTITASATWYIRSDYLDDLKHQIDAYEKSEKWKLPDTLNKINAASEKMSLTIDERNRLNSNKITLTELVAKNIEISKELEITKNKLSALEFSIKNINSTSETIELKTGESHPIFRNALFIGLTSVKTQTQAEFNLNNESISLDLGVIHPYTFLEKKCVVTMTNINYIKDIVKISNTCN